MWRAHVRTFIETQVFPELAAASVRVDDELVLQLIAHVDAVVRSQLGDAKSFQEDPEIDPAAIDALAYEQHCALILSNCGWTIYPTPATGDHGADVVAEKDGWRLVVQCKLYAKPVGNKAVQEVYAALPLYNGSHACVVAPFGFTAQAQRAAHGLSVRLLHYDGLRAFADELVSGGPPGAE